MAGPEAGANKAANKKAPDLVLTRVFDAPREVVFKVWTDPKHVARWWGPRGFQTTIQEMDVRPGGRWRYAMKGPDGNDRFALAPSGRVMVQAGVLRPHVRAPEKESQRRCPRPR
jgi:uncharacterized protein YndB with AHSA1/START domain